MIIDKIKDMVLKYPNNLFYVNGSEKITYKELYDEAFKTASYLRKQGNGPVIIYGHKELYVIKTIISCLLANRTYIPIDTSISLNRFKDIINLTNSDLIISDINICINNIKSIKYDELIKFNSCCEKNINNDIVYIIFTSGSTGIPKGVPISKTNLINFIEWISNLNPLKDYKNINVFNQANFSFDLSVADFYYTICNGHTLYAYENIDNLYDNLNNIDFAVMTPTMMQLVLLNSEFNESNYPKFKCVYFCGEILSTSLVKELYERFPNLNIINAYGPTEATSAISAINITNKMLDSDILPVGDMNNLAVNVDIIDNEIVLKGKSVFKGYLGYASNNNITYKTGDIGYIKNNMLYCNGRLDSQIKYKGYRIELCDIENNILKIDRVLECIVLPKYNLDHSVKLLKAYLVVDNITVDEVRNK